MKSIKAKSFLAIALSLAMIISMAFSAIVVSAETISADPSEGYELPDEPETEPAVIAEIWQFGDVNGDKNLNILDLVRLSKNMVNMTGTPLSDVNNDSIIDAGDIIRMKAMLLSGAAADENGGNTYTSFEEAVAAASEINGIVLLDGDVTVAKQIKISGNIKIANKIGKDITVTRSANVTMFYVDEGNQLVLGTSDESVSGSITVDAALDTPSTTRIVDNRSGSTFVLGANATLKNIHSNQWGSAIINRGNGNAYLYGNVTDNICTGDGGAVLQHGEGKTVIYAGQYKNNSSTKADGGKGAVVRVYGGTLEIKGGSFEGNATEYFGGVVYVDETGNAVINGGEFNGNTAAEGSAVYVNGTAEITAFNGITEHTIVVNNTLNFNNITNANIIIGENGTVTVLGTDNADNVTLTPYEYTEGNTVLVKGEEMSDEDFAAVCESVKIAQPATGSVAWSLNTDGTLKSTQLEIGYIGDTYYKTLYGAVQAANESIGPVTIHLIRDAVVSTQITVRNDITICNEQGKDITINRGGDNVIFSVPEGKSLTLGTND